jgi:protein-tyrosine phosphatase
MSAPSIQQALHRVLTHPLIMAAKGPLKDAWWSARGHGLTNPPMPAAVGSILFVCKGNICRSPFAAARAAQLFAQAGLDGVRCTSAGIVATQAAEPPLEAHEAASAYGLAFDGHQPTQVTAQLISAHDITIVMDADQMFTLRQAYPRQAHRLFLLPLLEPGVRRGYARYNITDPFGQPLRAFGSCYRRIDSALKVLRSLVAVPSATASRGHASQAGEGR